jgi:glycerol-3-phosphate O-acyltransferase
VSEHKKSPSIVISLWLSLVQWILVRYVKTDREWVDRVRAAARTGPVFFVLRNRSLIDFLCLRGLCRKHRLPEISFVTGLSPFFYLPFVFWLVGLFRRRARGALAGRLRDALGGGGSALVFLRRPAVRGATGSRPVAVDGIRLAVEAQAALGSRVQALPTVFLWGESPMKRMPGTMDFIFGSNEYPRLVRSIWLLLRRRSVHELQVSAPLDLRAVREERGIEGRALSGVIRAGVGRQIELIRRTKLGSFTKPSSRVITEVAKSMRLRRQLETIAESDGIPTSEIAPRTKSILVKMAADFRPRIIGLFAVVMTFVWRRIYTGIDIRPVDVERLREAVTGGATALILPTHKSHMDYLVVSHVMRESNLMLPHIWAGQNLSFWPLGWLFRSSGAFFIRRRLINDRFYTAVVTAYLRRLIQMAYPIEVFIEGGRSRTGKLLRPRTGMLDMTLKALAVTPRAAVTVAPVFIGYEHVIEESAYVAESEGIPKRSESIKGLLKTSNVLFHRYGRLYVRVSEPFSIDDVLAKKGMRRDDLLVDSVRRAVALEVGIRTLSEINRRAIATPSSILSTVLLTHNDADISHDDLTDRALWMSEVMTAAGADRSSLVAKWAAPSTAVRSYMDKSIRAFLRTGRISISTTEGVRRYRIREGQRLPLDYYKNNTIHFLAPAALLAGTLAASPAQPLPIETLYREATLCCRLYQWEFLFEGCLLAGDEERAFYVAKMVDQTLDMLRDLGLIQVREGAVTVVENAKIAFLANVLRNYHEVYLAAVEAVREKHLSGRHEPSAKLVQQLTAQRLAKGEFVKPEGHSALNQRGAMNTLKELKLIRPAAGEAPFDDGALGDELFRYLCIAVGMSSL